MKTLLSPSLLVVGSLLLTACASEPPHSASGKPLKLETIRRPNRPPVYMYREAQ